MNRTLLIYKILSWNPCNYFGELFVGTFAVAVNESARLGTIFNPYVSISAAVDTECKAGDIVYISNIDVGSLELSQFNNKGHMIYSQCNFTLDTPNDSH